MKGLRLDRVSLITLTVIGLGLICLWNGWQRVGTPFPGFLMAENRIVMSMGRSIWLGERAERILFAEVIGVNDQPVAMATEFSAALAPFRAGDSVTFRFRKNADVFNMPFELRRFDGDDFQALYGVYFVVGVCFALSGWWATRGPAPIPSTRPFFLLSQLVAAVLFLGCDVYGAYWFTSLYLLVHCLLAPALWHLTTSYPEPLLPDWPRRMSVFCLYAIGAAVGWLLSMVWSDPSLILPLVYTTYLMLANALIIYVGRLAIAWRSAEDLVQRASLRLALVGSLLAGVIPAAIFVFYPSIDRTISPALLAGPLVIFALATALALRRLAGHPVVTAKPSAGRRFALLFLAAAETAYVAAVGVSWMNRSWEEMLAASDINHHQQMLVQRLRELPRIQPTVLDAIASQTQRIDEAVLVDAIRQASVADDREKAYALASELMRIYDHRHDELERRAAWLSPIDEILFGVLVGMGILQAVGFMLAVRNWLMRPMAQVTAATGVIATGNLQHRVEVSAAREFIALGDAINSMAASLDRIQQRVELEREARHRAAATARDSERRRFGHELHDGVLQDLIAVKLQLEGLDRSLDGQPLAPVVDALIQTIVGLRRLVDDISAPDLAQASLPQAISAYASTAAFGRGISVQLQVDPDVSIPEWATRDVYRIAQEAIGNAVRHGTPSRLRVMFRRTADVARLEIQDDGSGFDASAMPFGTGMRAMRERTTAIGAHLSIQSFPGRGTVVKLDGLPLQGTPRGGASAAGALPDPSHGT